MGIWKQRQRKTRRIACAICGTLGNQQTRKYCSCPLTKEAAYMHRECLHKQALSKLALTYEMDPFELRCRHCQDKLPLDVQRVFQYIHLISCALLCFCVGVAYLAFVLCVQSLFFGAALEFMLQGTPVVAEQWFLYFCSMSLFDGFERLVFTDGILIPTNLRTASFVTGCCTYYVCNTIRTSCLPDLCERFRKSIRKPEKVYLAISIFCTLLHCIHIIYRYAKQREWLKRSGDVTIRTKPFTEYDGE